MWWRRSLTNCHRARAHAGPPLAWRRATGRIPNSAGMPRCPVKAGGSRLHPGHRRHALFELAREHDVIIEMRRQPGQFVIPTSALAAVAGASAIDERLGDQIRNKMILGPRRTATQDVEFSIAQLVEIAARALSPGVNDFYTAIACVDHLAAALAVCSTRPAIEPFARRARTASGRALSPGLRGSGRCGLQCDPPRRPRQRGGRDPAAREPEHLATCAPTAAERDVLGRHGRLIAADALRETENDKDRSDILSRSAALQDALAKPAA